MMNWRDIDTSTPDGLRALDVEIAKRLGVSVCYDEQDKDWWERISGGQSRRLTRYSTNLNSTATLPIDEFMWMRLDVHGSGYTYAEMFDQRKALFSERFGAQSEALARCFSWLAWRDAQVGGV